MNLLVTGAFKCTDEQKEKLNLMFSVDYHDDERSQVQNPEKYDAVICNGLFLYNDIERFTNLKIIQLTSAGLDRVPLQRCKERGIEVKNARGVYSTPISEWAVLKILEIYKFSHFFKGNQNKKVWVKNGFKYRKIGCRNYVTEKALLKYLQEHPECYDARKADYYLFYRHKWFIDKLEQDRKKTLKTGVKWTDYEKSKAKFLKKRGLSYTKIAEELGRTRKAVIHFFSKYGE